MTDYKPKYDTETYLRFLKAVNTIEIDYNLSTETNRPTFHVKCWMSGMYVAKWETLENALDEIIDQAILNKEFDLLPEKLIISVTDRYGVTKEHTFVNFTDRNEDDPTNIENVLAFLTQENKYLHEVKRKYKEENALLKTQIALMKKRLMNHLPAMAPLSLKPKPE